MWSKIKHLKALLSIPRLKLPHRRIIITVDLDRPRFDSYIKKLVATCSLYGISLTAFSVNEPGDRTIYTELKKIVEFANENGVPIEIGSHSIKHEYLSHKDTYEVVDKIQRSVTLFRNEGFPVYGFRAPHLSIERVYGEVLKELGKDILKYDSSVLFERNLFYSRIHDLIPRKCPHKIVDIWELPLSCLDDFHLFDKLKQTDKFVAAYWKKKVDTNINNHNYFLILIHPPLIAKHFHVLEDLLTYCTQKYSSDCFATCFEIVQELSKLERSLK